MHLKIKLNGRFRSEIELVLGTKLDNVAFANAIATQTITREVICLNQQLQDFPVPTNSQMTVL